MGNAYLVHIDELISIIGNAYFSLPLGCVVDDPIDYCIGRNGDIVILPVVIHGIPCLFSSLPDHLDFLNFIL